MFFEKSFQVITLLALFSFTSSFIEAHPHNDFEDLGNGVYAGQSVTQKGETVYFGCELVDSSNVEQWKRYASQCKILSQEGRGPLHVFAQISNQHPFPFPYDEDIKTATGFTEAEFTVYIDTLFKKEAWKKTEAIQGVCAGVCGFEIFKDDNQYVTYASKKPVKGRFSFEKTEKSISVKDFSQVYDDLLMCVGTTFFDQLAAHVPYYRNRGIFKNPANIIEGGYGNISLQLHGFSALVAKYKAPYIKYMLVSPIPSMQGILVKSLKPGDAFIGHNNDAPYVDFPPLIHLTDTQATLAQEGVNVIDYKDKELPESLVQYMGQKNDYLTRGEGALERNNLIKVEALINIYGGK